MHAPWNYKMHSTGTYKITTQAAPNRKIIRTYMTTKSYAQVLEKYPSIKESNMIFPKNILQLVYAIPSSDQHTFQTTSCSWSMSSNILINILFRQHFVVVLLRPRFDQHTFLTTFCSPHLWILISAPMSRTVSFFSNSFL